MGSYEAAKNKLLNCDFSDEDFFLQNDFLLEYGYCKLLKGDVDSAEPAFKSLKDNDLRADWAFKLLQFIKENISTVPSYFQIRNFLEIDLHLLIKAGQASFVENIINDSDIFYSMNPESYKFIARVMLYNDFNDVALFYLNKAKNRFYYDPEMHFMMANCYIKMGDRDSALNSVKNCLYILPQYFPAKRLKEALLAS